MMIKLFRDKLKKSLPTKKMFFLLVFAVLNIVVSSAQITSREDKRKWNKAEDAFYYGDYLAAMKRYKEIYHLDSAGAELNFKLGVCTYSLRKYRDAAQAYFEKVPPTEFYETSYYLGKLNHLQRNYDKSLFYFNQYKGFRGEKNHATKEIDDLIKKCNTAMLFESKADKTIKIENLGPSINTEYAEYAPLIPAEENFILFTSRRKNETFSGLDPLGEPFEDIYISRKISDKWQKPILLDTNMNTPVHDASTGLSADGEKMFIYRTSKDLTSGDIYESHFVDNVWEKPIILGSNVNSKYLETSACYSDKGDVIYFSSTRPGGYGGKDLYRAKKLPNGKWGEPYNLGPSINTEYNEDSPYIHPMGGVLYFSSEGHENMGGYDILKIKVDSEGGFSKPENLGYPINTVGDDIFFVMNTDGSKGYLSSGREGGFGSQDIYVVKLVKDIVPVNVYNIYVKDSTSIVRGADVQIIDFENNKIFGFYKGNENSGKILVISEANKEYEIIIKAKGYKPFMAKVVFGDDREIIYNVSKKVE